MPANVRPGQPFGGSAARTHDEPMSRVEEWAARHAISPPYRGVVGARWRYVRYSTGEQELYDMATDPYELRNIMVRRLWTDEQRVALGRAKRALRQLTGCSGVLDCRR